MSKHLKEVREGVVLGRYSRQGEEWYKGPEAGGCLVHWRGSRTGVVGTEQDRVRHVLWGFLNFPK